MRRVQTPSRIPENKESRRTLRADPLELSTKTDTYSAACETPRDTETHGDTHRLIYILLNGLFQMELYPHVYVMQ